ncbi:MAG TPA: F0F1 ATP synthase subunit A [Chloroflexota bacterium]|nr:F0F1 ATP synthase subunit A [Chloroflexota bacterium]
MSLERPVILTLFGLPVTSTVVTTWVIVAVLLVTAALAGRRVSYKASRSQAVLEWGITTLRGMLAEMTGTTDDRYLPLVATVASFVLVSNLVPVIPWVEAPTADINTPIALSLIVFFSVHYFGVRELGVINYLRKFAQPVVLLLPINVLSQLTRTFSLAIRLFGNMISHQIIVAILLLILPLMLPAVLEVFGLFIGVIQAYIFTILTIVYIGSAVRADGDL